MRYQHFILPAIALAAPLAQAQTQVQADIPAGPLADALSRFAQQSGVAFVLDARQVQDLQTHGLKGSYGVEDGFNTLLHGSGYVIGKTAAGYRLVAAPKQDSGQMTDSVLPAVSVKADSERESATGPVPGVVAKRSATGTKTDSAIVEVPQSISVIGAREIDDKGMVTLTDALAQTAGVTVNPYGFDSRAPDWVMLRGFDGWYTSSYRDGLAQNVGITFLGVQTEIYGLERLEVLRGPASVLFGKGDVGGVVNRVSKVPSTDALREIGVQLGRYDRKQVMADLGGALDGEQRWLWRVVGVDLDTGTQESYPNGQRMKQKRRYLAPSLTWHISPQTSLTLQAEALRDDSSDDIQYVTAADGSQSSIKEGDPNYSRIETDSDAAGYQLTHTLDNGWQLQQKARYAHRSMDKHHIVSFFDVDPNELLRQARHDVESVRETAVDTSLQGTLTAGGITHRLLFGVDYDRNRAEWQRWQDMTSSLDMVNPVYGISIAEPATNSRDKQVVSEQLGVYAQDQLQFDQHWRLTLGVRQDRARTHLDDRLGDVQDNRTDNATTGRIGASYLVGNGWAPYASYGESFVPVMAIDDDVLFSPSRGKQIELGVKYIPEDKPWSFTAAVYNLKKTNVVSYDPVEFVPHALGLVRSRGLELEGRAELSRQLWLTGSFTALNMKILSSAIPEEVGNMPILTPKQTASLWLDYATGASGGPGLSVGGGLRYTGKRYNDAANTSFEDGYTVTDAAIRYDTGPWRFALNVSNLFDRSYLSGRAYGSYFRGAERNVILTAKYRW
ncbi:TonB-dependent siderophore receptor [Duganella sp. FT80W]|uniref:TonB-dependent siderophore receptor n=1 Tax=Duganella guangzhouensis TaxID=2666084 RepID=A0A6I2KZR0_9BURK|nr:TonB-dependent siderophore receptor [Duganella guangzhouensis]MRW89756.1 TonB-dependent siderophore receptor [Duganella guangzhouensis]